MQLVRAREPAAARLTIDNTGDLGAPDPAVTIETGRTMYRLDRAGNCTADALGADPGERLVTQLEPARGLGGVIGGEPIGHATVSGVEADGYRFDERAIGLAGVATATGEVWMAAPGGYVVSYSLRTEGGPEAFGGREGGTFTMEYTLTDAGTRTTIDVPDDCPPGMIDGPLASLVGARG